MPLPTSGEITMDQICTEFKIPLTSDLGCDALRKAAKKPAPQDISMSDFYGLSNLKFTVHKFKLTLGASDDYAWADKFNSIGFSSSLGRGAISPASINAKGVNVPITDISFGVYDRPGAILYFGAGWWSGVMSLLETSGEYTVFRVIPRDRHTSPPDKDPADGHIIKCFFKVAGYTSATEEGQQAMYDYVRYKTTKGQVIDFEIHVLDES